MHYMERREKRTLTDEDIDLLVERLEKRHVCMLDDHTRHMLSVLTHVYKDAQSAVIKTVLGLIIMGLLLIAAIGSGFFGGK